MPEKPYLTPEEYLERECPAEWASEYHNGVIVEREHPSLAQIYILSDLLGTLGFVLRHSAWQPYSSQMRVKVPEANCYFYPDMSVGYGEGQFEAATEDNDSFLDPCLIIEVYSPRTEAYDRGEKFAAYRMLPSLTTYVLIAEDRPHVEVFVRQPDSSWRRACNGDSLEATIPLPAIGCELAMADIYNRAQREF